MPNDESYSQEYRASVIYDETKSHCKDNRDYSASRGETYSSKMFKKREEYARTPTCVPTKPFEQKSELQGSRSRSYVGNISRSGLTDTDKGVLRSGKKLGDEINKIQSRIEEMEKQKKRLNINFTPFSSKNRSASVLGTMNTHNSSIDSTKKEEKTHVPHFRSTSSTKDRQFTAHFGNQRESEEVSRSFLNRNSAEFGVKTVNDEFELSLEKVEMDVKTVRIDKGEEVSEEKSINKN